jgi:3-oxo-4,17-pregnadiene-20-carboxyl-CoA hydratase alpha subunit
VDVADDEIEIGMPLRVDFNTVDDELTLPIWRRAE